MIKAFRIIVMTVCTLLVTTGNSRASTVVYDRVELFKTETFFTEMFDIDETGRYRATLTDFNFPVPMSATGMSITTATDMLGSLLAPGSFMFNATPGKYFVSFFGFANESTSPQFGQYGIEIQDVPVPTAVWLFGSGFLGLVGISRRKQVT
jgi:hypothetical protein